MPKVTKEKGTKATTEKKVAAKKVVTTTTPTPVSVKKEKELKIYDTSGNEMDPVDYFFTPEGEETIVPPYFTQMCGDPVDREDLVKEFDKVFDGEHKFLFYKVRNKEIYVIIVPLKLSIINHEEDALSGEFQKHAISFIYEGGVNMDSFKRKIKQVRKSAHTLKENE